MTNAVDSCCTVLMHNDDISSVKTNDIRTKLDSSNIENKKAALKQVILLALNGESQRNVLMPVIKSCLQCDDDNLKKILLIFWESCDMTDSNGKLLPEMILVCNYIRNDLESPNEYIRGSTLRLLCKIKHPEILESLIPVVTANLTHRHSYVRKNAILAVFEIYQALPDLIPDAPEKIATLLVTEPNLQTKRNAFLMLFHCDIDRAVAYLDSVITQIPTFGESFQMVVLELVRKVCRLDPACKGKYIRCVYSLLNSESNTVAFEGACTLLTLSTSPTAVRACVTTLSQLLTAEADHNVKLIVLDRIDSLRARYEKIVQESIMDILRALTTPNIDIRKKTLGIVRFIISNRNVHDVVNFLKKEIMSTETSNDSLASPYRTLLVEAVYECAMRFTDVASSVVLLLLNFISDESGNGPLDVMYYVRGIIQEYDHLRFNILEKLLDSFSEIKQAVVYRVALWVIGEYCNDAKAIDHAKTVILSSLAPIPFESTSESVTPSPKNEEAGSHTISSRPVILSDGTYAQQSTVVVSAPVDVSVSDGKVTLHSLIKEGQYFLATVVCNTLTKLALKQCQLLGSGNPSLNVVIANALIVMASMLRYGTLSASTPIDQDSLDRIRMCIRALTEPHKNIDIFLKQCREVFIDVLKERRLASEISKQHEMPKSQVDDCLSIRLLRPRATLGEFGLEDDEDVGKAVGNDTLGTDAFSTKLNRVFQLTGFSDPVYGEAYVTVHQYDIVLDILIVNQTNKTLQNLSVELITSGDLKLVERPQGHTIVPYGSINIQAVIKVSSTESGMIFGNIVYDMSGSTERQLVVMNTVLLDIMDYIVPATCSDTDFRTMWVEFEWENKVPVNTDIQDLEEYAEHIISLANMKCITERGEGYSDCNFLAVNLYARSIFGEDALANVSVEKLENGNISGYIRIRAKTQGIALSLGDRIIAHQRQPRKLTL